MHAPVEIVSTALDDDCRRGAEEPIILMWMAATAQAGRGKRFAAARREWLLGVTHDTEDPRYSAAFLQSVPWYVYAWVDGRVAAGVKFMISQIEAYVEEAFVHTEHRGRRIVAFMLLYAARTFAAGAHVCGCKFLRTT